MAVAGEHAINEVCLGWSMTCHQYLRMYKWEESLAHCVLRLLHAVDHTACIQLYCFGLQLVYAFGFMPETETTEEPTKSLQTFDFFLDGQAPPSFESCSGLLDTVIKHVESPYGDVQIHAWHTLSQITGAKTVAEALLKSKIHGRDAFQEIKSCAATSPTSHDQHRLISKTMRNLMNALNTDQAHSAIAVF